MGTVLHTWPNGRFVQIQDGFRSKEMMGPINGPLSLKKPCTMASCTSCTNTYTYILHNGMLYNVIFFKDI